VGVWVASGVGVGAGVDDGLLVGVSVAGGRVGSSGAGTGEAVQATSTAAYIDTNSKRDKCFSFVITGGNCALPAHRCQMLPSESLEISGSLAKFMTINKGG
jgi:hypothetical protein